MEKYLASVKPTATTTDQNPENPIHCSTCFSETPEDCKALLDEFESEFETEIEPTELNFPACQDGQHFPTTQEWISQVDREYEECHLLDLPDSMVNGLIENDLLTREQQVELNIETNTTIEQRADTPPLFTIGTPPPTPTTSTRSEAVLIDAEVIKESITSSVRRNHSVMESMEQLPISYQKATDICTTFSGAPGQTPITINDLEDAASDASTAITRGESVTSVAAAVSSRKSVDESTSLTWKPILPQNDEWGPKPPNFESRFIQVAEYKDRWVPVFIQKRWFTEQSFRLALESQDKDAQTFVCGLTQHKNLKKVLTETVAKAAITCPYISYEERIRGNSSVDQHIVADVDLAVDMIYHLIKCNIIEAQKDPWQFIANIDAVMSDRAGKRRTLLFEGDASSGKSLLASVITAMYEPHEIGLISTQNSNSTFWLQDVIGKSVYMAEELMLDEKNVQAVKMLFEGNPLLKSDVKFADHQMIPYRPVIVTTNHTLWRYCSQESQPIKQRVLLGHFRKRYDAKEFTRNRTVQAHAWRKLVSYSRNIRQSDLLVSVCRAGLESVSALYSKELLTKYSDYGDTPRHYGEEGSLTESFSASYG